MATAPPTDPFALTGNSREDLARMMSALRGDPSLGFRHDPGPMEGNACAPAPEGPVAEAHRRVRIQLGAVQTVLGGRPALLLLEEAVDDLHYAGADYRARTIMLEETLRRLGNDVDAARSLAARLEEEVARLSDPWIGRYLQGLEDAVPEDVRDRLVAEANAAWREAGSPAPAAPVEPVAVAVPDPGLPIVDDASLPERALQFRGSRGELLAVGALERVFGALDQATEIAVGALTDVDGPDAAHPLDDLEDAIAHGADLITWPDGTQWRLNPDGSWQLIAVPPDREFAHVATPAADRSAGSRRVDVGGSWGPYGDPTEAPRPAPPGPADPPKPPHHNPVA